MRHLLRSATRSEHERVDAAFSVFQLDTRPGYVAFLRAQAPAVTALEDALTRSGIQNIVPDWPRRRRSEALRMDLRRLDGRFEVATHPAMATPEAALAALYVLEGSRLGGRLLLERVLAAPDAELRVATDFLRHGQQERLWQGFLALLEARSYGPQDKARMVASARSAFALFERSAGLVAQTAGARDDTDDGRSAASLRVPAHEVVA